MVETPSQLRPETQAKQVLYQMPEVAREVGEGAVNAGLAKSPEQFWGTLCEPSRRPGQVERVLERLVRALIAGYPARKREIRNDEARVREAVNAIVGTSRRDSANDKDDREILAELALHANDPEFQESDLRSIARTILRRRGSERALEESAVRRVVGKFKSARDRADDAARNVDDMAEILENIALKEVLSLLASVGVQSRI